MKPPAELLPVFRYHGPVLEPAGLRYCPHPDIIHPSVIDASAHPLALPARFAMYYAPHDAPGGICLALADRPEGPWREYDRNPVIGRERPPHYQVSHVSSPHALWSPEANRLLLYFHGENDTTRYALSRDGIHFEYGGVAVNAAMFGPTLAEASYARVFRVDTPPAPARYLMLLMGNDRSTGHPLGTRKVYAAWSDDGLHWRPDPRPWLTPPPGTDQMGPGSLVPWKDRLYLVAFANQAGTPINESVSDLYLYSITPDFKAIRSEGLWMSHTAAGSTNRRINDPCFLQTESGLYLFVNVGRRLNQSIGLCIAPQAAAGT